MQSPAATAVLALVGRDDMLIGLDPAAGYSDWQPIVDSCTVACHMLRDRLFFVDGTCREARPVRNSRFDPEAKVPAVDRVVVYIGDPRGAPVALQSIPVPRTAHEPDQDMHHWRQP